MTSSERPLLLKWGSSSTTNANGIDEARIEKYADQIAEVRHAFPNIVVVASGSVAVGKSIWLGMNGDRPFPSRQTLATLGTAQAHIVWQRALAKHGLLAGQLLATHHQVDDHSPESILDATIRDSFNNNVIQVANENDALNDEEMAKFSYGGENDGLASHTAIRVGAAALVIFTDTEGLMHKDDHSRLIRRVAFDDESARFARVQAGWVEGESEEFENSMLSKINACLDARNQGIGSFIAQAGRPIIDVLEEQVPCTYFETSIVAA